ncbi:hypothetical protein YC2023_075913 [Brassica napus]
MTALDYNKNQPRLQDKHLTQITNTFSALAEFPPLSYAKAASSNSGQTSSKSATPTQKSDYYTKPYYQHIHTTHFPKPITLKELQNYINRVFYETSLWTTDNVTKNQTFYEYILVDSMFASIVHHENQNNPDQIDYSTCKIIRVASYRDLGFTNLHTQKPFNTPGFYIPGYTYTDYQNAFFYTFFRRPFTHSCEADQSLHTQLAFFIDQVWNLPLSTDFTASLEKLRDDPELFNEASSNGA